MSQRNGFTGGFLAGVILGGVVGGVIGALLADRRSNDSEDNQQPLLNEKRKETKALKTKKNELQTEESIEMARRSLEDKIAQLNTAIDDVRHQLGQVNGSADLSQSPRSLDS